MAIPTEHVSPQTVFHRDKPGGDWANSSTLPKIRDREETSYRLPKHVTLPSSAVR